MGMGTITAPTKWEIPAKITRIPEYKIVSGTRLARKMYPDFKDNKDGTITIITGYKDDCVILGVESGFTYIGTPKK